MKKIICKKNLRTPGIIILAIFLFCQNSFSFSVVRSLARENIIKEKNAYFLKASVFVNMTAKEFTAATSKELGFFQKNIPK